MASTNGLIQQAQQYSVQDLPDARKGESVYNWYAQYSRPFILPQWGTRDREQKLRLYDRHEYVFAWQGASSGIGKKFAGTPFEITGPEGTPSQELAYWQDVFRNADFGLGWGDFAKKGSRDYLRQDGGWYFELIAPGDPLFEPTGPVMGIAHLDSLRCYPTGDPNYPVIYWSRYNEMHILHRSRVAHVVDMPDGDESNPGYGLCALSRAISIITRQILMGRYIEGRLDDNPPPGLAITNLPRTERDMAQALYKAEQSNDEKPFWGKQMWFHHSDPSLKPEFNLVAFSQAPEKFSYKEYMDIDINALALALGVDIQELWQLTGGQQGSQAQSEILNAKSRGKTFGDLLTSFERVANDVLPEHLTFEFKYRDEQEEKEKAENAQLHGQAIQVVSGNMSQDEVRQYLANNVPAFADVLLDESGKLKPLAAPSNSDVVAGDITPIDAPGSDKPQDTPGLSQPPARPLLPAITRAFHGQKDFISTRREFINSFVDLVNAGRNDDVTRRRFGTVLRAQLRRLGAIAYRDGLRAGGVNDDLTDEDLLEVQSWSQEQSVYVTNFGAELFQKGLNPTQVYQRAEMWSNKSLEGIYQKGLASAYKNGLYTWVLGNTEKHCTTCLMMSGQTHRLKEYTKRGIVPKSSKLDCGGWLCDCQLKRAAGTSKGRFPREKAHVH